MARGRQAFVSMGANLGDRYATISSAIERLASKSGIHAVERSSFYETDPVGDIDQPQFLNLVVGFETSLTPEGLLELLMDLEREFGRVRTTRWGPRTLDLDLLAYESESRSTPILELPHPRMLERPFVLVPLAELLEKSPFRGKQWDGLRKQIDAAMSTRGVRIYVPSTPPN
jgi:2-amino-4-hydroxy-6-hydroxymethyldihydropteridine diphosphokinase